LFRLGAQQLPGLSAIVDRGEISEEQKKLLYEGTDTKTISLFMKLRAQEELEYVKVLSTTWGGC
jgi:hypothetical protein